MRGMSVSFQTSLLLCFFDLTELGVNVCVSGVSSNELCVVVALV